MPCVIFLQKDTGLQKSRRSMSITELKYYFFICYNFQLNLSNSSVSDTNEYSAEGIQADFIDLIDIYG